MALSDAQVRQLKSKLEAKLVKTRRSNGTETQAKSEKRKPHLVKASPRRCAFPLSTGGVGYINGVADDKRACAPTRAPVADRVDLADGTPGCAQLLNHSPIVIAKYTGLRISCGCGDDGERERDTYDAYYIERA